MKNETKITAPKGCEYAGVEQTPEGVVVKWQPKEPFSHLPRCEGDFEPQEWSYMTERGFGTRKHNTLATKQDFPPHFAPALIAFIDLLKYLHAWREGWEPDWGKIEEWKHCVVFVPSGACVEERCGTRSVLAFQDEARATAFLETFRDKIEAAKPLL